MVPIAFRRGSGTFSPSNASVLPELTGTPSPPHQAGGDKNKNKKISPTWHSNLSAWPASSGQPPPGLLSGQVSKSLVPPDPATQAQNSTPESFSLALVLSRVRQNQPFLRWGKGHLPCFQGGQDSSLSHTVQLSSCPPPKVLPENKVTLRFTAGCTGQTPPKALSFATWAFPQTLIEGNFPGWCYKKQWLFAWDGVV